MISTNISMKKKQNMKNHDKRCRKTTRFRRKKNKNKKKKGFGSRVYHAYLWHTFCGLE